jgi:hypothetical protein
VAQPHAERFAGEGKKQRTDRERIAGLLRTVGYQRWIALKYESPKIP